MSSFRYEAVDAKGRRTKGMIAADTQRKARREIQAKGLTPLTIKSVTEKSRAEASGTLKGPSKADVIGATRQLATLVDAATTVEEALSAVGGQMRGSPMGGMLLAIRSRIVEGWRLSDALGEYPKAFSPLYRAVVAAGEEAGTLGPVMLRLADMLEKNRAMVNKAVGALIYPAAILALAIGVVAALMNFVVPRIVSQFATTGEALPLLTVIVIGASTFFRDWGLFVLIALVASGIALWRARRQARMRIAMDKMVLRLPIVGGLLRDLDAARFSRTLATLFAAGTPLLDSLRAARRTVTNAHIHAQLEETLTGVREGASLSNGLKRAAVFPGMLISMVTAGERSGRLAELLDRSAEQMEADFDGAVTVTLRLLEPAVIVLLGGVVMVIVLAIMLPILQINTLAI